MLIWSRRPRTSRTRTSANFASLPSPSAGEGGGGYRQAGSRILHGPPAPAKRGHQRGISAPVFVALVAGTWCPKPGRPPGRSRRSPAAGTSSCVARLSVLRTVRATSSPAHRIFDLVSRRVYSSQANVVTDLAVALVGRIFCSLREAVASTPVADRLSAAPCAMFAKQGTPLPDVPGIVPC
jgi:hypothetical protein